MQKVCFEALRSHNDEEWCQRTRSLIVQNAPIIARQLPLVHVEGSLQLFGPGVSQRPLEELDEAIETHFVFGTLASDNPIVHFRVTLKLPGNELAPLVANEIGLRKTRAALAGSPPAPLEDKLSHVFFRVRR